MNGRRQTDAFHRQGVVCAVVDEGNHLFLVAAHHQFFPAFVIVGDNRLIAFRFRRGQQVAQGQCGFFAEPRVFFRIKISRIIVLFAANFLIQAIRARVLLRGLRRGPSALPVRAAEHGVQLPVAVEEVLGIGVAVDDFTVRRRVGANLHIRRQIQRNRLFGFMRVAGDIQRVLARFQFIAAETVAVCVAVIVARRGIRVKADRHRLALAGLKELRLCKADKYLVRLLDAAQRVGRGGVQLHHFLARDAARVLHCHRHGDGRAKFDFACGGIAHRPVKRRVAQTVAEGIDDVGIVPVLAVGFAARLIVAIADVNAFFVVHGVVHAAIILVGRVR